MNKKNTGFLNLLTGIVAGATAVLLSKKENRIKVIKALKKTSLQSKQIKKDLEKNPDQTLIDLQKKSKKIAKKAFQSIRKIVNRVAKKTVEATKTD